MKKVSLLSVLLVFCLLFSIICTIPVGAASLTNSAAEAEQSESAEETDQPKTLEEALERIAVLEELLAELQKEYDELKLAYDEVAGTNPESEEPSEPGIDFEDAEVIKLVQQTLNDAGYGCGSPDGAVGTMTIVGITSYQKDHDLDVNGTIDYNLIDALGILAEAQALSEDTESDASNLEEVSATDDREPSMGEKNALSSAKQYLRFMAFSYTGLIGQLEYEGYSHDEAVYGADHCEADWLEQAAKSAESYLKFMSFSKSGLIEQLEYEGFTHEQAVYGAEQNGY